MYLKKKDSSSSLAVNLLSEAVIDEYFANGFNATKAVMKYHKDISYESARARASEIMNEKGNQVYIQRKKDEGKAMAQVESYQLVNELKNFAFADITDYMGKTEEEIKQLPSSYRRALKKATVREKSFKTEDGSTIIEKTYFYELHDKIAALDKLGKHIGFYEADNKQKTININLNEFDNVTLNNILQVVDKSNTEEE